MTEKEKKNRAGSISRYATLGKSETKTPGRLDAQTSDSQSVETPEPLSTQESRRLDVQESGRSSSQTSRSQSVKRERHTIYLPPGLSEWVKIRAIKEKREISEVVEKAVEQYREDVE